MRDKGKIIEEQFHSRNGFDYIKVKGMKATMVGTFGVADKIEFSIEPYLSGVTIYSVVTGIKEVPSLKR